MAAALLLIQNQCVDNPTKNYATTHGLLLLSKYPLKDKQIHTYHPDIVVPITRGYIAAKVISNASFLFQYAVKQIFLDIRLMV